MPWKSFGFTADHICDICGFSACQGTGAASAAAPDSASEAMDVDGKSTDELMEALRASRDQVPALNMDGVCVFLGSAGCPFMPMWDAHQHIDRL